MTRTLSGARRLSVHQGGNISHVRVYSAERPPSRYKSAMTLSHPSTIHTHTQRLALAFLPLAHFLIFISPSTKIIDGSATGVCVNDCKNNGLWSSSNHWAMPRNPFSNELDIHTLSFLYTFSFMLVCTYRQNLIN